MKRLNKGKIQEIKSLFQERLKHKDVVIFYQLLVFQISILEKEPEKRHSCLLKNHPNLVSKRAAIPTPRTA